MPQVICDYVVGVSGNSAIGPDGEPGPQGPQGLQGPAGTGGVSYVDECTSFNPCTQKCVDTYDSYYCACDEGYELTGGQNNCPQPRRYQTCQIVCIWPSFVPSVIIFISFLLTGKKRQAPSSKYQ